MRNKRHLLYILFILAAFSLFRPSISLTQVSKEPSLITVELNPKSPKVGEQYQVLVTLLDEDAQEVKASEEIDVTLLQKESFWSAPVPFGRMKMKPGESSMSISFTAEKTGIRYLGARVWFSKKDRFAEGWAVLQVTKM